jgi:dihydroorotate dehydrogenase (NAD+) catalytic subunit
VNLEVEIAELKLQNPVMAASGTFGYGAEYASIVDIQKLGAIVCKGTTLEEREGNPQPRIWETPSGILNSVGLENPGVEEVIRTMSPIWETWQVPVIVNIAGNNPGEYALLASRLDGVKGVSGIEVNLSCPNVEGIMDSGENPGLAFDIISRVRKSTSFPVVAKLGYSSHVSEVACACEEAGADALTVMNSIKGMAIDIKRGKPALGNVTGGLSGPAIKPIALYLVYQVAKAVSIPVIGCGGISSGEDALEFMLAGARAIQVGAATLSHPQATVNIIHELEEFCLKENISSLREIIGLAQT